MFSRSRLTAVFKSPIGFTLASLLLELHVHIKRIFKVALLKTEKCKNDQTIILLTFLDQHPVQIVNIKLVWWSHC